MRDATALSREQYEREVAALQQCQHENLLQLLGSSSDGPQKYFVFAFKDNGSLRGMLDTLDGRAKLNMKRRLCISLDVASGLEYIHTVCSPLIVYRTSNLPTC